MKNVTKKIIITDQNAPIIKFLEQLSKRKKELEERMKEKIKSMKKADDFF